MCCRLLFKVYYLKKGEILEKQIARVAPAWRALRLELNGHVRWSWRIRFRAANACFSFVRVFDRIGIAKPKELITRGQTYMSWNPKYCLDQISKTRDFRHFSKRTKKETARMDIEEEEEESVEKMEQTRLRELRKMFASSLKNCFEPCAIDVRFISR